MDDYILSTGSGGISSKGCSRKVSQLNSFNYLEGIPGSYDETDMVEVQFKNTRIGFFLNANKIPLEKGDIVAVEASPGHDIGTVIMTGRLVKLQMQKARLKPDVEIKRIYRKARDIDMEKYAEAKAREEETKIRSRQIAKDLGLEMKIGDVEYQGDGCKAIFYYIADGRVDFRQLIKVLADAFHVRIEMKQIGARQEAGRIGGIGPCGRELCCSTWMTSFVSVSTGAARFQDLSMNPQKLAGQCAKLKCCLNYEVDAYVEAQKHFPARDIQLETLDNTYYFFKADILARQISYSTDKVFAANLVTISAERAMEVIAMNRKGQKPQCLSEDGSELEAQPRTDILDEDGLTRFDHKKRKKNKNRNRQFKPESGHSSRPSDNQEPGSESGSSLAVNPKENKQQDGKAPEGGAAIAEKGQRNTNHRSNPKHHSHVNKDVKKENTGNRVSEGPAKN